MRKKSKKYLILIILERNEIYAKKNKAEKRGDPER
jgi:hypothetical protein